MSENISNKLNVLDFIIIVLKQHEKSLDKSVSDLESALEQLKGFGEDRVTKPLSRRIEVEGVSQKTGGPFQERTLRQIELVVLRLIAKGNSCEEISLRLDMNPTDTKEIIADLVMKGCLPKDTRLPKLPGST